MSEECRNQLGLELTEPNVLTVSKHEEFIPHYGPKVKQKILEEEEYLSILEHIVEKDFFPELSKLKLRTAYLDALETNDLEKLRDIQMQLEKKDNEGLYENEDNKNKQESSSLNGFLYKNTSEDNASFEKLMELTRKKQHEKYAWLFEKQKELNDKPEEIIYLKSSLESNNESKPLRTWPYKARNALMYTPDGVEASAEEEIKSKGNKKQIIEHKNTRFNENPFDNYASQAAMIKATRDHANLQKAVGKIGIDGKLEQTDDSLANLGGYTFVATPSPAPGVDASPLMTWGQVEMTPKNLDQVQSFKIPEPPRREVLAHSLAEKASKQHREKRKKAFAAATASLILNSPRTASKKGSLTAERLSQLSPAAQKLVKANINMRTDKSLRESYSPSPLRYKKYTPSHGGTPSSERKSVKTPSKTLKETSITDNLLNLKT